MTVPKFKSRATEKEIIDDFTLEGSEITDTFESIEKVNIWLGGNQVLVDSLRRCLQIESPTPIRLHDLGCGSGDGLISLAKFARKKELPAQFTGVDANAHVIAMARRQSRHFPEIEYRVQNIFAEAYQLKEVDIATFNLCLHHFTEAEIEQLLQKCKDAGVRAIIVNDLHRHWLAYYAFYLVCWIFRSPKIAKDDGLLSIRKGFKRQEFHKMAQKISPQYYLRWRWAFRWQLLIFLKPEI
ncbi:MAG TPA: methyltransferase domain-containing protein [Saprospiraceae bacterium]|nr:methyltransferase domain-containing protein [Saprospiraceae bacterium]